MKVVCISDSHQRHRELKLPEGDLLIHAGDITNTGSLKVLSDFRDWFDEQPHKHKIVIAGNHDLCFVDKDKRSGALSIMTSGNFYYLEDSGVEIEGFKIWGSPWQPRFHDWAFNLDRGYQIAAKWDMIPNDTNILVTHGPPFGYGDRVSGGSRVGCCDLIIRIEQLEQLRLHVFGHIHEDPGHWHHDTKTGCQFVNATSCNLSHKASDPPIVVDL